MATPDLNTGSDFWNQTESNTALLDVRLPGVDQLQRALVSAAAGAGLKGHAIFATSGSTGRPKFACLSQAALLTSARAVNAHLQATDEDHWFCALPSFHVGGVGIWARAHVLRCGVTTMQGKWEPRAFCEQVSASEATLTAMVPTQVHDIVAKQCGCPDSLRRVLIGGGALRPDLRVRAGGLGWPLAETFGMTETGSQIATEVVSSTPAATPADPADPGAADLVVLPIWGVRTSEGGVLELEGDALFSGYLEPTAAGEGFALNRPFLPDGWFRTSDRVELRQMHGRPRLRPLGRTDDIVKILGENVDISAAQAAIQRVAPELVLLAIPDQRAGMQLIAVVEETARNIRHLEKSLLQYNRHVHPPERVSRLAIVQNLPTTELGKVAKDQLIRILFTKGNFRNLK